MTEVVACRAISFSAFSIVPFSLQMDDSFSLSLLCLQLLLNFLLTGLGFFSPPNGLSSSRGQGPRLTLLSCLRKRLRHVLVSVPLKNKAFPNVAFFPIFHTARALEPTIGMDSGSPFRSSLRRCAISHHAPARVNVGALHGALQGI